MTDNGLRLCPELTGPVPTDSVPTEPAQGSSDATENRPYMSLFMKSLKESLSPYELKELDQSTRGHTRSIPAPGMPAWQREAAKSQKSTQR